MPAYHEWIWDPSIIGVQRFLFVIALMIPFEIRDLEYDQTALHTLPQIIGIKKARFFGISLLVLFFLLEYGKDDFNISSLIVLLLVAIVLGVLITLSRKRQPKYYASFIVEAVPVLWLLLLVAVQILVA